MRFHARLSPGVVDDPEQVVEVRIHSPARCEGVTVKLWELDTFYDPETGAAREEGSEDDLLAEFQGAIEPGGPRGAPDWRRFVVSESRIVSDDPSLARVRIQFPGSETIYDVPIVSEAGEAEGREFELGVSLEHDGAERFKTRVPCLFAPPLVHPHVIRRRVAGWTDEDEPDPEWTQDEPLAAKYLAIGVAEGEAAGEDGYGRTLRVLARGYVDAHGRLVRIGDDGAEGEPLALRAGRALYVYVYDDPDDVQPGVTGIPIAACDPIGEAGEVIREEPDIVNPWDGFLLEPEEPLEGDPSRRLELPEGVGGVLSELLEVARRRPRSGGEPA